MYKGLDIETCCEIAWNVIQLKKIPRTERMRISKEVTLIRELKHDNIIRFVNGWHNKEKDEVVFITEMVTGGSLRSYLRTIIKNPILRVIKGWCK